ncbi:MAG: helicase-related protein [Hyphomicrobiaceae bacterium]
MTTNISQSSPLSPLRSRNVTAVLGPTNTGKTHLAIERMLGHQSGLIGLPLRLLAREVYDRIVARVGPDQVALVTGEEKIKPEAPRYWVSTVEAMPRDLAVDFLAIDEIQLAADAERGHVFTDRLFNARGQSETLLLGAATMRETIKELLPGANFVSRPRLSKLTYAGQKKISRLPRRSAVVAFSAGEVYEIAELIRRTRGGAAVVLGALSPRTRNAQVALYQSGDVDYLVATDAIGMGLNLDLDHVAFAAIRKFDGRNHRMLSPSELGQIAGRAGRHMNDGSFGVTGDVEPFEADLVEKLENHDFEAVKLLQWRNSALDFGSLERLRDSLRELPRHERLTRARAADDVIALDTLAIDPEIADLATRPDAVSRLWDVCQVPDYRKMSATSHAELIGTLYKYLMHGSGRIPEDWFAEQVARADRTDGDIDTLANRIAHIRTWTFVSNRADWLEHPGHWQGRTREIEDTLSDALHEQLAQRFVDKRTSTLIRRLRDEDELDAKIAEDGAISVENHFVGRIAGFLFTPDTSGEGIHEKAARNAATQVLTKELAMRARRVASARPDAFRLTRTGRITWRGEEVARLERQDDPLKPTVHVLADEHLAVPDRERVQGRLAEWLTQTVAERLKPLIELSKAEDVNGMARGIAFRLKESYGVLKRETVAEELKTLDQEARAQLRRYGVRFGAFNIYFPLLLKPAATDLLLSLRALHIGERAQAGQAAQSSEPPRPGLTSVPVDPAVPEEFYRVAGFHVCGPRAVRIDMLERLADMIRPLIAWRPNETNPVAPPKGASGDGGFIVIPEMMSILGCSSGELGEVLKSLGFWADRRPARPKPAVAEVAPAAPEAGAEVGGNAGTVATSEPVASEAGTETAAAASGEPGSSAEPTDNQPETAEPTGVEATHTEIAADALDDAAPAEAATTTGGDGAAEGGIAAAPVEPAAETGAGAAADAVASGAPAEPEIIEIWRPRRRRHGQEGERRQRFRRPRPGERREAPVAIVAEAGGRSEAGAPTGEAAATRQGRPGDRDKDRERRHDRNRDRDRKGGERRGERGDAPREGQREGRGEGRGNRDRQRRDGRRDDRRPGGGQERGLRPDGNRVVHEDKKRETYDPNSPFAALTALRQQLEDKQKNPQSS